MLHITEKHNALVLINSLYGVDDVALSPSKPAYVCVCVTYLVLYDKDQTIISNYDEDNHILPFHEISASNKEIRVWVQRLNHYTFHLDIREKKRVGLLFLWNGRITDKVHFSLMIKKLSEPLEIEEGGISIVGRFGKDRLMQSVLWKCMWMQKVDCLMF